MIRVTVKQEHINKGSRQDLSSCPIALALNEKFGTESTVGSLTCSIGTSRWWLPREARKFVERFDITGVGEPFSFELTENTTKGSIL